MTEGSAARRRRVAIVVAECLLPLGLLAVWLSSEAAQTSQRLTVLFLYSFPSEFLVGLVPHEPVLIWFGTFYSAWIVALVASVGTVLAERMNYSVFSLFYETRTLQAASRTKTVAGIMELFSRRPFLAILVAGFTPVPFFPVRFLVVMTGYPVGRYLWGVFLSRTPRFWLLAALGAWFEIPTGALGGAFLIMLLTVNAPALVKLLRDSARVPRPDELTTAAIPPS